MGRVAMFFTGGTISMTADRTAGGNIPTLDGAALLARTPGLGAIAEVVAVDRGRTPASHFTLGALLELARAVDGQLADPAIDGAVVVQGTDTIEESSFLLDLVIASDKAVIVTGAMRAASDDGYDGPANLRDALRCAASPVLAGEGTCVVLAGAIYPSDDVVKSDATALTTFQSPNLGPLGQVVGESVVLPRRRGPRRRLATGHASERVHLITAVTGMDGSLLDAALAADCDGLVIAATGSGNTSPGLLAAGQRAIAAGVPVVLTTRCHAGRAGTAYAFPGGGATWVRAGAMLAGSLSGPKARVALALGIGAGLDGHALAALLADPAALA
jgi:L-asparaginase